MIARESNDDENPLINDIKLALKEKNNKKLREIVGMVKTTPVALRTDGPAITCLLLSQPIGLDIFFDDDEWRDTLTESELNAPDPYGRTAIGLLCKDAEGRALVDTDDLFRKKITSEGFCFGGGKSAAYSIVCYPGDMELIMRHSDLRHKITEDFLNRGFHDDSMPMVFELSKTKKGIAFLTDPIIRQKLSERGMNKCTLYYSPVSFMTKFSEGVALLADEELREKIHAHALNVRDDGKRSAVSNICQSEDGCEILAASQDLCSKFSAENFNNISSRLLAPLYLMVKSPAGRRALLSSKHLCRLIDEEALNNVWRYGDDAGGSALFYLLASEEGRQLFLRDRRLRKCIQRNVLFCRIEHGEHAGRSVADLLMRFENNELLRKLDKDIQLAVDEARHDHPGQTLLLQLSGAGMFHRIDVPVRKKEIPETMRSCTIL